MVDKIDAPEWNLGTDGFTAMCLAVGATGKEADLMWERMQSDGLTTKPSQVLHGFQMALAAVRGASTTNRTVTFTADDSDYRRAYAERSALVSASVPPVEYQWGVVHEGRNLGWIPAEDEVEARHELQHCEDKYLPAYVARRTLGPIERVA